MVIVALFTFMAVRLGADFVHTGRFTGLLLLASEALVVVLTVFRRSTAIVDRSVRARVLMTVSLLGPLLVAPTAGRALTPEAVTVIILVIGLFVVIGGKVSLGRSFGLMPANRGVVSTGMYQLVRHPIYMGYLITHVGFVAANPTLWNVMVLVGGGHRAARPRRLRGADARARPRLPRLPAEDSLARPAGGLLNQFVASAFRRKSASAASFGLKPEARPLNSHLIASARFVNSAFTLTVPSSTKRNTEKVWR